MSLHQSLESCLIKEVQFDPSITIYQRLDNHVYSPFKSSIFLLASFTISILSADHSGKTDLVPVRDNDNIGIIHRRFCPEFAPRIYGQVNWQDCVHSR